MGFETYIKNAAKARRTSKLAETNQMTLGELIAKLETIPLTYGSDNKPKSVVYDFEFLVPTTLDSWRGSYGELALGWTYRGYAPSDCPDANGENTITLEELLDDLRSAVGKQFTGWKGGEFTMSETTPIWVANPGNSGNTTITEVVDNSYEVILMTGYCEY